MIPKRIICTHTGRFSIQPRLQDCLTQMEKLHRGWEFLFFSDGDCRDWVARHAPGWLDLYDWYPRPVLKADFFRVLSVFMMGGFYLDTDVWLARSLDPLCDKEAVFPWEHQFTKKEFALRFPPDRRDRAERWQLGNYAFGARARHPFFEAILEEMVRRTEWIDTENCPDLDVLQTTGPDVVTAVYYRHRDSWTTVEVMHGAESLPGPGPNANGAPPGWFRFGDYGTHLINGGWRGGK